jgi:CubicO group peptidase (beta-lactamase class C family)
MRLARVLVLCVLLAPLPAVAQTPTVVRDKMAAFVSSGEIAGAVTVVGRADGVLCLDTVGDRTLSPKAAMTADTLFRIASMTKPITAVGIMILADEGKLGVNDPVEKHLPEFKGQMLVAGRSADTITLKKPSRPITLKDLLTHTSGLPGSYPPGLADVYATRNRTLAEAVIAASQRPLDFEPGTKWAYCNTGIDALGRVIEAVSGKSYEAFLQQRVFDPLKMADTTFHPTAQQLSRLAACYDRKADTLVAVDRPFLDYPRGAKHPVPAGGLFSTAGDLAKLYRMMLNNGALNGNRILTEASVAEMTRLQTGDLPGGFTPGTGFGYGWAVVRKPEGVTAPLSAGSYGHGGAFGTQGWLDPEKNLFVVLLIQRVGLRNADASPMRDELQKAAVGLIAR